MQSSFLRAASSLALLSSLALVAALNFPHASSAQGVAGSQTVAQNAASAGPSAMPASATPLASGAPHAATSPAPIPSVQASPEDPFLWLEDAHGDRAMAWVRAENAKTLAVLEGDPRFESLDAAALKIYEAKDRVPVPEFLQNRIYNFWQDAEHVRGIWRETSQADYANPAPAWQTVLDLDAVAKSENANWVWAGADCNWPEQTRCLVSLSDGGEDATTVREFDLQSRRFVSGGFELPHGKQDARWETSDSLLVAREWKPGELTTSGYAYVVKRVLRGRPLSAAVEVYRGLPSDVGAEPEALQDAQGHHAMFVIRELTTFTREAYLVTAQGTRKLNFPHKMELEGMVEGRVLLEPKEDWTIAGATFPAGSLVSLDLSALSADPEHPKPTLVYAPGERESLQEVETTKSHVLIATYQNVRGRAYVYAASGAGWSKRKLDLPDNSSIHVISANLHDDDAFLLVTSFLTPSTLVLANAETGSATVVRTAPARFDASKDVVEQYESTSKDGTKIPYFVVHPKNMPLDGSNPTILYAYGGFQISLTPYYSGLMGKLWLERGGVFVIANIRGGGEFGPAWHEAGLKTHRQVVYDDFASVAQDLIARKITSPRRLGIQGGSNGGLLMGVEFTQHPELYRAVDIQVPLLDMLRYEQIAAGSSWVGEYGSVSVPAERAFLASISPYNNLRAGVKYPEPLIWTTTKDDRVGPQHARKFAAKLSALGVPYLFYEVIEGGHGAGANLKEDAHTTSLEYMYFIRKLMD
jgi:prolyl oligopeptidase